MEVFDPSQCATSPIPDATRIVSRKTFLKGSRARRTAEIEHDVAQDKNAWSASIEGVKWTGVSVFRLESFVEPRMMRTGKGRETGTSHTKPDVQLQWPREVTTWPHPKQSSWYGDRSNSQQYWGLGSDGVESRIPLVAQ